MIGEPRNHTLLSLPPEPDWASRVMGLQADPHSVIPLQDEKAEGLINVSNYSLESGQDQKKK